MDTPLPKRILASLAEGIYVVDQHFEIVYLNPVVEREFGPVAGRKCYEYFHDLSQACSCCQDKEIPAGQPIRREWQSSKTQRTYELFVSPIPGDDGACWKLGVFRDVTEYMRVSGELRFSEIRYRTIIETMTDGLVIQDTDGRLTYANLAASQFPGGRTKADFQRAA